MTGDCSHLLTASLNTSESRLYAFKRLESRLYRVYHESVKRHNNPYRVYKPYDVYHDCDRRRVLLETCV